MTRNPSDWILRAKAALGAGDPSAAIATLHEAEKAIRGGLSRRRDARQALRLLESIPEASVAAEERSRLEEKLRQLYR